MKCELCNQKDATEFKRCYPMLITKAQEERGVSGIDCADRLLHVCSDCNKDYYLLFYNPETKEIQK